MSDKRSRYFLLLRLWALMMFDSKEICEVFTKDSLYDAVHRVYGCPGHLFVTLNKGKQLKTYDIALPAKKLSRRGCLYIDLSPSPIVQVCFFKKENTPAFIVYQNGLVEVWSYSYNGAHGQWTKIGYFILCDPGGAVISSVLLDEERSQVFWMERSLADGQQTNKWRVRVRKLTIDLTCADKPCVVGKATSVIVNCPRCKLYQYNGDVCIWPGSPSPPGLYFIWHIDSYGHSHVNTCVLSQGCLQTTECKSALDLKAVAASYRYLWVQVAEQSDYDVIAHVCCLFTGCIYLISSNGCIHSISGTKESLHICSIDSAIDIQLATEWFIHKATLGVITDKTLSLISLDTGDLVQQIDLSTLTSVTEVHSWCIVGSISRVGLWSVDGIWMLQTDKLANFDHSKSSSAISDTFHPQPQVEAHSHLEILYNQYSKGEPSTGQHGLNITDLVGDKGLQSPALIVAALQETTDGLQSESQAIVEQLCQMYAQPGQREDRNLLETPLNQQVYPLLRQYWGIHTALSQCFQKLDGCSIDMISSLQDDMEDVLSHDSTMSQDVKRSQLSYLMFNWPIDVLKILIKQLHIGDVDSKGEVHIHIPGPSDLNNSSHPLTVLAVEAPDSASGLPLFEILCRLLYTHYPGYLIALVEGAQRLRDEFRDTSAFTRKKHALQLCNLAIESLPSQSCDHMAKEEQLQVRGQLLNMSGKTAYILEAVRLYLTHSMWEDAIHLVKIHADQSRQHSQMFHILISALIKVRPVFHQFYRRIWECAPNTLSALDMLQFLRQHHQPSSIFNQDVFCQPDDDLQLGQVKGHLLMLLSQEKALLEKQ